MIYILFSITLWHEEDVCVQVLTLHIHSAPTGQHYHVGGGARRPGWLDRSCHTAAWGGYTRGRGCSAGIWVTHYHCKTTPMLSHITTKVTPNKFLKYFIPPYLPSLLPVSAGRSREEFWCAVALATALAVTVKAVWGTSLGIRGTSLRPSIDHSEELFGPDMLFNKKYI